MVINSPCLIDIRLELVQRQRLLPSFIHTRSYPTQYLTSLLMANLDFCDKHNMVAFLEKSTGSAGFHQIIDIIIEVIFCYALTKKPEVCVSFIKQFWRSAEILTDENGNVKIHATIDGHSLSITEGSLRRHLKLDDQDGITSLPTTEIFAQLALMGYATDSDKLTFQKGAFSPQWRFLIHNILHCLSPKKTAWEQFSSNIAAAVICLATNRKFNFSRMIFDHMVSNISSPHKFLMYPRFVQLCLDMQRHKLQQHTRVYSVPSLTMKVFSNMKRITKGFSGQEVALFPNMLAVPTPSASPSNSISSPEPTPTQPSPTQPSPQPSPIQPSPTQLSPTQPGSEYHPPIPHDSPLHAVHSHGSVCRKLEAQLKVGKARRHSRFVLSDTEVGEDDSSKQGRKFSNEGVQDDEGVHEKASTDTEIFVQEVTPTEVIQEGSEKVSDEVSTAGLKKGPVSEEVPTVSTAEATLSTAGGTVTYSRRSAEKRSRKDKGKAILIEEEPKKKSKKDLEQEQLSYAEAIRLEEQMNEEQRAQIARDAEIARQWDEEERKRAMDAAKSTEKIDWNDPSVIRYHSLKMKPKSIAQARRNMIKYLKSQGNYKITDFKGMSYNDIRPIFEKLWDFNQNIVPMDAEKASKKQKSPEKERTKSPEKERSTEKIVEEEAVTQEEREEVVKNPATKRKKFIPRKTTRKAKARRIDRDFHVTIKFSEVEEAQRNYKIHKSSSAEMTKLFERIISRRRRLEDFIQKKLVDLKDNHKFRGGLTGKVNIPHARPQPVPTGKPKVPAPVPTGRQNRPFPVPTDRGYSPSVTSGKQHKASYKAITAVSSISEPLQLLHMDLFGPTSIRNRVDLKLLLALCITDDYNRTEFKNAHIIELCGSKGIKRDYSNTRTPQQNGVAERKNRTLIEAARTMLADSKLPTMFWTEAVSTACYVLNRVLITHPHIKTPYALLTRKTPSISHFKPFGCHVTILNTSDHLGKFDGKDDERYLVGYSASNKAYRDDDSDSDSDEQVILVPSYPSNNIPGDETKDTSDAHSNGERTSTKLVPTGSIQIPSGETTISPGDVSVPTGSVPVPTVEPRSVAQALEDPSWVDVMQDEMQQFKFQNVWVLVDLPEGKYAIGTKWILKNKRDARGLGLNLCLALLKLALEELMLQRRPKALLNQLV
ncbi:putative ribonuclease H-like domain-containing protein [Tanacetum coccineum]|uniref:Ribonuclease H-like domain-containing protein n=1 Tax=Tanacetum coccineum TaxID=301880 RepID=A0ABQ4X3I3_9ASTR